MDLLEMIAQASNPFLLTAAKVFYKALPLLLARTNGSEISIPVRKAQA